MDDYFSFDNCNLLDVFAEGNRFVIHITLIHIINYLVGIDAELFHSQVVKTIVIATIAVLCYHLFIKKLIEPHLKTYKTVCYEKSNEEEMHREIQSNNNDRARKQRDK
jgi:hypothetical protein